jgi:benzoate membrane transport protein
MPPLLGALVAGAVAIAVLGRFNPEGAALAGFAEPIVHLPAFSWQATIELVVPLAITVLVVQNGQGYAVLGAAGHGPPVNAITAACGAGSIAGALVGAVSTCLTGPVNAIVSSAGERRHHYVAGIMVGVLALAFGWCAPTFTRLLLATPAAFIATLAGLALLRVLQGAFTVAFGGRFTIGALVTFIVTVADVPILNVGAPFWGLVFGGAASWLLEREETRSPRSQK